MPFLSYFARYFVNNGLYLSEALGGCAGEPHAVLIAAVHCVAWPDSNTYSCNVAYVLDEQRLGKQLVGAAVACDGNEVHVTGVELPRLCVDKVVFRSTNAVSDFVPPEGRIIV